MARSMSKLRDNAGQTKLLAVLIWRIQRLLV